MYSDRQLLDAVIHQESRGNPNAVSPKGAAGIMQIMPATARDPGYGVRPLQNWDGVDPRTAPVDEQIRFGKDYLDAMIRQNGGNIDLGLAAYNAGQGAVEQYGGVPPFAETQNYVRSITANLGTPEVSYQNSYSRTNLGNDAFAFQQPQSNLEVQWDDQNTQQPFSVEWDAVEVQPMPNLDVQWDQDDSYGGQMRQNVNNRMNQMQQSADAYVSGEQGMLRTAVQQGLAGASILPDAIGTTVSAVTPDFVKDIGSSLLDTGKFIAKNTIGQLPSGDGKGTKLADRLPLELEAINEGQTPFLRDVRAAGQAVNLFGTGKALSAAGNMAAPAVQRGINAAAPKLGAYIDDVSSGGTRAAPSQYANIGRDELKQLSNEAYDEAAYLGDNFTPDQVSNKLGVAIKNAKPKPIAGTVLTKEQKILSDALDEYTPLTGKNLTLDDVQQLDKTLTAKINSFVDPRTGELDATGRDLFLFQTKLRKIVDDVDTVGNDALVNAKNLWKAQTIIRDLNAVAERASFNQSNVGKALQRGYANLLLDKDRILGWPPEAKKLLETAAKPGVSDEILDWVGSRLPAAIGLGTGNIPAAAGAHMVGIGARGAKESIIANRGMRVQQSVVDDVMSKMRPIDIPEPSIAEQLLLPSPQNMSRLPMSDTEVNMARRLMARPTRLPEGSEVIKPPVSRMANLRGSLGKSKGREFEAAVQIYEQGTQSQNQFVKEMVRDFNLTQTQARQLAKEIKTYGAQQ